MQENTEREVEEKTEREREENKEIEMENMEYWKMVEVPEKEGDWSAVKIIEQLKDPYLCSMEDDWGYFMHYYHQNPGEVNRPITVYGDTAIHVAASFSTGEVVVKFLINHLRSNDEICNALKNVNIYGNNAFHEVAMSRTQSNLEEAEFLFRIAEDHNLVSLVLEARNNLGETPLYRAAALGHTKLVQFFILKLNKENDQNKFWKQFYRNDRMSILHIAVIGQHFETAYWLQKNYPFLAQSTEGKGLTSLQLLAQMPTAFELEFYRSGWKMLIYHCIPADIGDGDEMVTPNQKDDVESRSGSNQPRQSICWNKLAVTLKEYYTSLWRFLAHKGCTRTRLIFSPIWEEKRKENIRNKLIHLLVEKDYSWVATCQAKIKTVSLGSAENLPDSGGRGKGEKGKKKAKDTIKSNKGSKVYNYTPLLIATITGIVPIVKEILRQHPQAAEHVSSKGQNILHLAIKHRQTEIFELIKAKKTMMWMLNERIDANGNTILHQAADRSYYSISMSQQLIGPAMQLQEELGWMSDVKKIVPRHYIIHQNKNGQTAEKLFNKDHDDLLNKAQDWIKDTAASCSTVAVLVATVVFAAAYAMPGGNDERSGLPIFYGSPLFWVFTVMDVVAIACSLSSVAFFLSILSSPLEYPNFCHAIPRKLMCGFVLLFLSMATTMVAFAATILLLVHVEKKWTKSLLYAIAFFPIPLFGLLQFPMIQSGRGILRLFTTVFNPFLVPFRAFSHRRSGFGKSKSLLNH